MAKIPLLAVSIVLFFALVIFAIYSGFTGPVKYIFLFYIALFLLPVALIFAIWTRISKINKKLDLILGPKPELDKLNNSDLKLSAVFLFICSAIIAVVYLSSYILPTYVTADFYVSGYDAKTEEAIYAADFNHPIYAVVSYGGNSYPFETYNSGYLIFDAPIGTTGTSQFLQKDSRIIPMNLLFWTMAQNSKEAKLTVMDTAMPLKMK